MQWFEVKGQLDFEQEQARKFAYFTTFYGTEPARRVWADIRSHILGLEVTTPESAIAKLALLDLVESIKESCGISNQHSIVDVETSAAIKYEITPEKKNLV